MENQTKQRKPKKFIDETLFDQYGSDFDNLFSDYTEGYGKTRDAFERYSRSCQSLDGYDQQNDF